MLTILHPPGSESERAYIFKVLLEHFLGIAYKTQVAPIESVIIQWQGKRLELSDTFFSSVGRDWLHPKTLPIRPLAVWDTRELGLEIKLINSRIPVIYGRPECERQDEYCKIGLDIFGSTFFMLSRYEEAIKHERDDHERFPAKASLAYQQGFLDRPIVNEYVEILWTCMEHLWPGLERKRREFRIRVSADVDFPYGYGTKNFKLLLRQVGGDIINRRNPILAMHNMLNYHRVKQGDYSSDPFLGNFEWMMDVNEAAGNRVAFYFIANHTDPVRDGYYSIHEPVIRALIRRIYERGHEIGLHASYNSLRDEAQIRKEADILRKVMEEEGVMQNDVGGRQHFLRWETPATARNVELAGLTYDTTLSFAEYAGFRCGTCYEYPFYDVGERCELTLRERPLVVMEVSVFAPDYMGRSCGNDSLEVFESLKNRCRLFDGDFTMLWHNNQFPNRQAREIYKTVIY